MSVSVNTNKARVVNDHHETNLLVIAHKHIHIRSTYGNPKYHLCIADGMEVHNDFHTGICTM